MDRSFLQGLLAGLGLVAAGVAAIAWGSRAARVLKRPPTAPNYAYLR